MHNTSDSYLWDSFTLITRSFFLADDGPPLPGQSGAAGSASSGGAASGAGGGSTTGPFGLDLWMFMIILIVVMFLVMSMSSRKEKKRRESMLSGLKKHDRVQTIGGVIGSVVEVKPNEVILKVDESSNTRMTFARSAIQAVLKEAPASTSA